MRTASTLQRDGASPHQHPLRKVRMKKRFSNPAPLMSRIAVLSFATALLTWGTSAEGATFTWASATTGPFSDPARWGGTAPTGDDITDVLQFNSTVANSGGQYTATNDTANQPFTLTTLTL